MYLFATYTYFLIIWLYAFLHVFVMSKLFYNKYIYYFYNRNKKIKNTVTCICLFVQKTNKGRAY